METERSKVTINTVKALVKTVSLYKVTTRVAFDRMSVLSVVLVLKPWNK